MSVRLVAVSSAEGRSQVFRAAMWSVVVWHASSLGCAASAADDIVGDQVVGGDIVAESSQDKDWVDTLKVDADSDLGSPSLDTIGVEGDADTNDSTYHPEVSADSSEETPDAEPQDALDANEVWSGRADADAADDVGSIEDSEGADIEALDVVLEKDGDGYVGGVDVSISECGKLVSPGVLSGKAFSTCMGFPLIGKSEGDSIAPDSTICASAPQVVAVTETTSVSLKDWYYIQPPGWNYEWAGAEPGGIQQVMAIDDDVVLVAGAGELNGDFFEKPARAVFGLVSRSEGVMAAAQSDPIPGTYALFQLNRLSGDSIALVAAGVANHRLLLKLDAGLAGEIAQTPFSFYYIQSVTAGLNNELIVAGNGPWADECDTQRVARLDLDAAIKKQLIIGGQGYDSSIERHIVPLGGCGYGYIVPANIFTDSTSLLPVIIRMDENLNVVGLWRWNVPAPNLGGPGQGIHAATVDGDVVIATPLWVMRVEGTTGEVKWYTKLTAPSGHPSLIAGLTVLPGGRTIVSVMVSDPDSGNFDYEAVLTAIGSSGCIETHYTLKSFESDWGNPLTSLNHLVALSEERIAGTTGAANSEILFVDLAKE